MNEISRNAFIQGSLKGVFMFSAGKGPISSFSELPYCPNRDVPSDTVMLCVRPDKGSLCQLEPGQSFVAGKQVNILDYSHTYPLFRSSLLQQGIRGVCIGENKGEKFVLATKALNFGARIYAQFNPDQKGSIPLTTTVNEATLAYLVETFGGPGSGVSQLNGDTFNLRLNLDTLENEDYLNGILEKHAPLAELEFIKTLQKLVADHKAYDANQGATTLSEQSVSKIIAFIKVNTNGYISPATLDAVVPLFQHDTKLSFDEIEEKLGALQQSAEQHAHAFSLEKFAKDYHLNPKEVSKADIQSIIGEIIRRRIANPRTLQMAQVDFQAYSVTSEREAAQEDGKWTAYIATAIGILGGVVGNAIVMNFIVGKQTKQMQGNQSEVTGKKLKFEDFVHQHVDIAREEIKTKHRFTQPYIDMDGKVGEILNVIFRPQVDQNNYLSTGPSRAGKSASSLRGLPQALLYAQMEANERETFEKEMRKTLPTAMADDFMRSIKESAAQIEESLQRGGYKGLEIYELNLEVMKAEGALFKGKDDLVLHKKLIEPLIEKANAGYKVILFIDEIQSAGGANQFTGDVAFLDKIKKLAEAHPNITLAISTTLPELQATVAKDPASLNRYYTLFHNAASPEKVISILESKPYVTETYGVTKIEPAAMKAIYLLGIRAHSKPSALTSVESYFQDILTDMQKNRVTELSYDYVIQHFEKNHGPSQLTLKNIDVAFEHERQEIEQQNLRDEATLKKVETELAGAKRESRIWTEVVSADGTKVNEGKPAASANTEQLQNRVKEISTRLSISLQAGEAEAWARVLEVSWKNVETKDLFRALEGPSTNTIPNSFITVTLRDPNLQALVSAHIESLETSTPASASKQATPTPTPSTVRSNGGDETRKSYPEFVARLKSLQGVQLFTELGIDPDNFTEAQKLLDAIQQKAATQMGPRNQAALAELRSHYEEISGRRLTPEEHVGLLVEVAKGKPVTSQSLKAALSKHHEALRTRLGAPGLEENKRRAYEAEKTALERMIRK